MPPLAGLEKIWPAVATKMPRLRRFASGGRSGIYCGERNRPGCCSRFWRNGRRAGLPSPGYWPDGCSLFSLPPPGSPP